RPRPLGDQAALPRGDAARDPLRLRGEVSPRGRPRPRDRSAGAARLPDARLRAGPDLDLRRRAPAPGRAPHGRGAGRRRRAGPRRALLEPRRARRGPHAAALLPKLVHHSGEPFADSTAIPTWYVSQLARQHVKVVLCGEGGDEILAGYETYRARRFAALYGRLPRPIGGWLVPGIVRR